MSQGGQLTTWDQRFSCLIRTEQKHVRVSLLALLDHIVFRQLSEFIADFSAQLRDKDLEYHDFESLYDIIAVDESLFICLEGIAEFFDQDIFITLVHLKLKGNKTSLLILKHIQEEISCQQRGNLGVHSWLVLGDFHNRLQIESADVLHAVAWMEGVQNFLALFRWRGEQLAILIDMLLDAAANEGLH